MLDAVRSALAVRIRAVAAGLARAGAATIAGALVLTVPAAAPVAAATAGANAERAAPAARPDDGRASSIPTVVTLCFEDIDIPPWRYRDGTGHNAAVLDAVGAELGLRFRYVAMPWRRCLSQLAQGRVDGAFALSLTAERAAISAFPPGQPPDPSARLFTDGYVLIRRPGSRITVRDGRIVGLSGPVATQASYSIANDLRRVGVRVDDGSGEPVSALRKVAERRAEAAALGISKARHLQASGHPVMAALEVVPEPLVRKDYHLVLSRAFSGRHPALARAIWGAIGRQRERVPVPADVARTAPGSGD